MKLIVTDANVLIFLSRLDLMESFVVLVTCGKRETSKSLIDLLVYSSFNYGVSSR